MQFFPLFVRGDRCRKVIRVFLQILVSVTAVFLKQNVLVNMKRTNLVSTIKKIINNKIEQCKLDGL